MNPALVDVSVLLLFHARADNFAQVWAEVRKARPARLFLYQDGPRMVDRHGEAVSDWHQSKDYEGIMACRELVSDENIDWQCEVHRKYLEHNQGCDPSGYLSQQWAFSQTDKCMVLEDDVVPSQSFFTFCKEMLDRYEHDERITMIAGYNTDEVTPSDESCYKFLLNELRSKHRNGYRSERCKIPGKLKPLITCPESNRCSKCPYPEYRDRHKSNIISWDELAETGYEGADVASRPIEKVDAKIEYGEIRGLLDEVNPIISEILEMKICDECSVQEIADTLGISKRNVYFYLDRAKAIGKEYNNN